MPTRSVRLLALSLATALLAADRAPAQQTTLTEGFENVDALLASNWVNVSTSATPGLFPTWFQGLTDAFNAQAGPADSFAAANFQAVESGTISLWLLTPHLDFSQPTTLSFFTRTLTTSNFPDRLQVRQSLAGTSTNVGTDAASVGDFSVLLQDINPTLAVGGYPNDWQLVTINMPAVANGSGRLALRYFVADGGEFGANSNFIGVDTLSFAPVPEPGSVLLVATVGLAGYARRRLRRA